MNIDKIPAEIHELVAKNILLSHGGIIYPMPDHLKMAVPGFDGTMHAACVESVLYSPGKWGGYIDRRIHNLFAHPFHGLPLSVGRDRMAGKNKQ